MHFTHCMNNWTAGFVETASLLYMFMQYFQGLEIFTYFTQYLHWVIAQNDPPEAIWEPFGHQSPEEIKITFQSSKSLGSIKYAFYTLYEQLTVGFAKLPSRKIPLGSINYAFYTLCEQLTVGFAKPPSKKIPLGSIQYAFLHIVWTTDCRVCKTTL